MPDGMPDGSFDSNQHGEATTPDWAPRVRVKRTDSRSGSRRRQDLDRTEEYGKRTKKRRDEKEAILRGVYDEAEHGPDQDSWVREMMNKRGPYKKGMFVPRSRRVRAVSAETHDDDGDAGDDESEEPGDNGDDATEVGGKKSRSGRHDPAAFDSCTAEEFKLLIECSEGLSTNCAYCNCRLDEATWEQRLVSRDDCPFGTYCRAECSQLHMAIRCRPAQSRYTDATQPYAVVFKPNDMCACELEAGVSALKVHGILRGKILGFKDGLVLKPCDLEVHRCCDEVFVPDLKGIAVQGALVLCSRSRRNETDRTTIPGVPAASAIATRNCGWVENTSTILVELAGLLRLMFSRFGPAHSGIKGFVASEQLGGEGLHGATPTGVISGELRKLLHHTLLGVTSGFMLATMQADGTLEMKWCKCFLCTELFALSIDGTEACAPPTPMTPDPSLKKRMMRPGMAMTLAPAKLRHPRPAISTISTISSTARRMTMTIPTLTTLLLENTLRSLLNGFSNLQRQCSTCRSTQP
jgi:hypothetical protein